MTTRAQTGDPDVRQVFVSYSHEDAALVTPVVRLLRATKGLVFQDADSIQPGAKWRDEISTALYRSSLVVVFWCLHSSRSGEVKTEYDTALQAKKSLLPVLLDSTPVPVPLSDYQWIDFRQLAGGGHTEAPGAPLDPTLAAPRAPRPNLAKEPALARRRSAPASAASRSRPVTSILGLLVAVLATVGLVVLLAPLARVDTPSTGTVSPGGASIASRVLLVVALTALAAGFAWLIVYSVKKLGRRKSGDFSSRDSAPRLQREEPTGAVFVPPAFQMATLLRDELDRRLSGASAPENV